MEGDPVERREFDGYVRRHEVDHFAHAPMRHDLRNELVVAGVGVERRLSALERWQQRIIGGLILAGALLGGGAIAGVVELTRHP